MPKKRQNRKQREPAASIGQQSEGQNSAAASNTDEHIDYDLNTLNQQTARQLQNTNPQAQGTIEPDDESNQANLKSTGVKMAGKTNAEIQELLAFGRKNKPAPKPKIPLKAGTEIALRVNYFEMQIKHPIRVTMYDIRNQRAFPFEHKPLEFIEIRNRGDNKLVFLKLASENQEAFGPYNTFGSRIDPRAKNKMRVFEYQGCIYDSDPVDNPPYYRTCVKMVEQFEVSPERMKNDYEQKGLWYDRCRKQLHFLDLVFKQHFFNRFSANYVAIGRSFFTPDPETDLGGGRELLRGFYQAPSIVDNWKLVVNFDIVFSAFHKTRDPTPQSGIYFACEILGFRFNTKTGEPMQPPPSKLHEWQGIKLDNECRGLEFKKIHLGHRFKCGGIDWEKDASHTIEIKDRAGRITSMTVQQYFLQTHNTSLRYPQWPLMYQKASDPTSKKKYLPIELCNMADKQRVANRKLTPADQQRIIREAALRPPVRLEECVKIAGQYKNSSLLQQVGMSMSMVPMKVPGRVLPAPRIQFSKTARDNRPRTVNNGKWNMMNNQLYEPCSDVTHALVLIICTPNEKYPEDQCKNFGSTFYGHLYKIANNMGLRLPDPRYVSYDRALENVDATPTREPSSSIKAVLIRYSNYVNTQKKPGVTNKCIVIAVLPAKNSLIYGLLKLGACNASCDLISQCIQADNVTKVNDRPLAAATLLSNLCLKINAKLGGSNVKLADDPLALTRLKIVDRFLTSEPNIFIGADVSHDTSGHNASIVGIASSLDFLPQRYHGQQFLLPPKTEIIPKEDLKQAVKTALRAQKEATRIQPKGIFFYRDGLSDSQFLEAMLKELCAIQEACVELNKNYKPYITYIVVQKGHHTRLFKETIPRGPEGRQLSVTEQNVPPGTAVNTTITHPAEFDFFLVSHQGLQGTSKPCHYNVLYDDRGMSFDEITLLSHYLCHSFTRCALAVSLPPPVGYAHLIAKSAKYRMEAATAQEGGRSGKDRILDTMRLRQLEEMIKLSPTVAQFMHFQ